VGEERDFLVSYYPWGCSDREYRQEKKRREKKRCSSLSLKDWPVKRGGNINSKNWPEVYRALKEMGLPLPGDNENRD